MASKLKGGALGKRMKGSGGGGASRCDDSFRGEMFRGAALGPSPPARPLCNAQTMAGKMPGPQLKLIAAAITKEEEGLPLSGGAN